MNSTQSTLKNAAVIYSGALVVDRTDILLINIGSVWSKLSNKDRLNAAQYSHEVWKEIRQPHYGDQTYIVMVDQNGYRVGGSKFPDGDELWTLNQGGVENQMLTPQRKALLTSSWSKANSSPMKKVIEPKTAVDQFVERVNQNSAFNNLIVHVSLLNNNPSILRVTVTDEWSYLPEQLKQERAEGMLRVWYLVNDTRKDKFYPLTIRNASGSEIGGTDVLNRVWVN